MSKYPSSARRVSVKKDGISKASKENVDTIYLIQNENQILKLKNIEMGEKITNMKAQLLRNTAQLAKDQQDCQSLRIQIKRTQLTDDIRLQSQKRALEQKIQLLKGNSEIITRKISEAREAAVLQEARIPEIRQDKKILERSLWQSKAENEGTKVVLENLQKQLAKQRNQNADLVSKRKQYGPRETEISQKIEQRLRVIKSMEVSSKAASKKQGAELLELLVRKLQYTKKRNYFLIVERSGYQKKILKKRVSLLGLIRKKYLLFVKNKIMQKLRQSFRPTKELAVFKGIIQNTRKRRIKNQIYRIWRSESNKNEYIKIRYFEAQATLEKFSQSYTNSIIFSTFNKIKYLNHNPLFRKGAALIESIFTTSIRRCQSMFFSAVNSLTNKHLIDLELEESAKEQSILLVLSVYFSNWAKLAKDNKVSNRYLKFKYFRQLKKLIALRKKRDLSEMLTIANEKIKQIDNTSFAFCHMKKETTLGLLDSLSEQRKNSLSRNEEFSKKMEGYKEENKQRLSMFGLLKIASSLKKGMQQAFNIWRKQNAKVHRLKTVMNMVHGKMMNDINLGFVMIQRRKFEKLKKSIADKIQSCEFSYNYLVKENAHIKQVLDHKLLELEKSKFSGILRKLIRVQKQIKHKYFYKFLKNGYKCWKFKRFIGRIDHLVEDKIKRVFMFLVKQINKQKVAEQTIESKTQAKVDRRQNKTKSLVFGIFENIRYRNKKWKRILQNVFSRNLELGVYNGYNKIKKISTSFRQAQITAVNQKVENKIKTAEGIIKKTEDNIQVLRQRLKNKEKSIKSRILLACRKIFVRNSSNRYLNYFNRWREKLAYEKRVQAFVQIMERKTRILLKNRLMSNLIKKKGDQQVGELKSRLENFSNSLNQATSGYDKFVKESENKMKKMQQQNNFHDEQGKNFQKRTDRMDDVKIAAFRLYWGKMMVKFAFREWKIHKKQFIDQWTRVFNMLVSISRKETFTTISQQMKTEILKNKIRKNLLYIYAKKFRNNAGKAFKIWRIVNLNARMKQSKAAFDLQVGNYKIVADKFEKITHAYDSSVNTRIGQRKLRKIFDFLKKYTRLKIDNNNRKLKLEKWLKRGYQIEFYRVLTKFCKPDIEKNKKADTFNATLPKRMASAFFYKLQEIVGRKKCIKRLFINKFIHYSLLKLYEQFFSMTKNYYKYVEITKKNHETMRIQKLIETFDKKRKDILCKNIRIWRKNQYQINIGKKLLKRITRKAIYNRYEGLFYAWKLESQARRVLKYHHEEGQIKKRKVEIKRIENFLHQFKKDKGLLLENQEGNFVMSPRFQKKKEEQQKKDKNLRYKFISKLIMTINGYGAPIKAYNNLHMYQKLREKYRKSALFVLNHLRRPDTLLAFRTWKKAAAKFKEDFQNMERKQLIKVLNRQKDKMEMEYSNKLSVDEKIDQQLHRYKILSHQRERKEKLCAYVFLRNAKRVKNYAFDVWRQRVHQIRDHESSELAHRGEIRLQDLEQEIREMKEIEEELTLSNHRLREAVSQAVEIAEMVKRISEQRDKLSHLILEKNLSCESLVEENQMLNSKLHLAQKEAIRLLMLSGERP